MSALAITHTSLENEFIYTELLKNGITIQQGNIVYIGVKKEA